MRSDKHTIFLHLQPGQARWLKTHGTDWLSQHNSLTDTRSAAGLLIYIHTQIHTQAACSKIKQWYIRRINIKVCSCTNTHTGSERTRIRQRCIWGQRGVMKWEVQGERQRDGVMWDELISREESLDESERRSERDTMTSGADDRRRREKKNKDDTEKVCEDRWRAWTHQGQLMWWNTSQQNNLFCPSITRPSLRPARPARPGTAMLYHHPFWHSHIFQAWWESFIKGRGLSYAAPLPCNHLRSIPITSGLIDVRFIKVNEPTGHLLSRRRSAGDDRLQGQKTRDTPKELQGQIWLTWERERELRGETKRFTANSFPPSLPLSLQSPCLHPSLSSRERVQY